MARILDLANLPGAYTVRLLMELGHDVIRVEAPTGDALRREGPFAGDTPDLERGAFHQYLNAGKRSFALDRNAGTDVLLKLVATADVVVASLPLPASREQLFEARPDLVLVEVDDGEPEICALARSGLLSITGQPGQAPSMLGGHVAYSIPGLYGALATYLALMRRDATGQRQVVTLSAQDGLDSMIEQALLEYQLAGIVTQRRGTKGQITALSGAFPCKDGHWMISLGQGKAWGTFAEWVGDPELATDPSLANEAGRQQRRDFVQERVEAWSAQFTRTELVTGAQDRHIPSSPVTTPLDLVADPQLMHRGFLQEVDHPLAGKLMFPRGPLATILDVRVPPAPTLGQHTQEILTELGYSAAEQQALAGRGVV